MSRKSYRRIAAVMTGTLLSSLVTFSQIDNMDFLRSAPADAIKFIEAYVSPWANAFGAALNGSWYNTAKPHQLGGFDITIGANVGFVPESAGMYDISSLGLSSSLSGSGSMPTISGPETEGPEMTYSISGVNLARFNLPPGTGWRYIPAPTAQVGVGLPLGTDLKIRFIPKIPIQDADLMLMGIGLMHSIMQYIPANEMLPVDASVFAGFTRLKLNVPINLEPDPQIPENYSASIDPDTYFSDQIMGTTIDALNISAIASLNLPVISFYGGLGYSKTRTLVELTGHFPAPVLVTPTPPGVPHAEYNDSGIKTDDDFEKLDIQNFSGLRANIGFRIKLSVFTIHADYTRAQYNVLTAGMGISFR
jgi:hypothetical protein